MGKSEATNLMDMPLHVQSHIHKILGSGEDNAWEYNENDRILIVDLHKLVVPVNDDDEKQMSDILTHVHLGLSSMHTWNPAQEIAMTDVPCYCITP
jgi:hypothetical protein